MTKNNKYLLRFTSPQNKKWVRVVESMLAMFCIIFCTNALLSKPMRQVIDIHGWVETFTWPFLLFSTVLAFLLYRTSSLNKIERLCVLFCISFGSLAVYKYGLIVSQK